VNRESVYFKTFGCRTNQFDTQIMMSKLKDYSLSSDEERADIIVVNSCTVTNGADATVRQYINSIKRKNPKAKVILAGCGAHSKGEELLKSQKLFGVMGHSEKEKINEILKRDTPFYQIGDLEHIDKTVVEEFIGKSRAFIKIQEGCNFRCSYCIIPYVRGNARSHPIEVIVKQVEKLASNGFGEFILTGTNVGSYGRDFGSNLARLIKRLLLIRGVRRIRIGSLEPIQIDSEFLELLKEPQMAKHLHIALQHTSDKMLELMNRRNSFKEDLKLFNKLSSLGYALGTDFIVGHPGEGEKEWQEAISRVKELPLTHIHAFTYSKREGTKSATMKDIVRGDIAKRRHKELTTIIKEKNYNFRKAHSKNLWVLVESKRGDFYQGFDEYYNRVFIKSDKDLIHNWINLESVRVEQDGNFSEI